MNIRILRWIIYSSGIICLYLFIASRSFPMLNFMLKDKMDKETQDFSVYGELYYMNCISDFREEYPKQIRKYRLSEKNPEVKAADILTFGDSFFDISFQKTLPERLADTLDKKVYSYLTHNPSITNPFCILNEAGYTPQTEPKYLIFESVERNIHHRFESPYDVSCIRKIEKPDLRSVVLNDIIFKRNEEQLYDVLLKHSVFSKDVYSAISTFKFDTYNYITSLTPLYKRGEKPWLFYYKQLSDTPGGFYYSYSREEILNYVQNMERLKENLKSIYNLEVIFMLIPSKYTIYSGLVNTDEYNDFLPELQHEMDKRDLKYINLYKEFKSSEDTLYFGTDTHWNKKGVDIAVRKTLEAMNLPQ